MSSYRDIKPKINLERAALILTLWRLIIPLFKIDLIDELPNMTPMKYDLGIKIDIICITVMVCLIHMSQTNLSSLFWIITLNVLGVGIFISSSTNEVSAEKYSRILVYFVVIWILGVLMF